MLSRILFPISILSFGVASSFAQAPAQPAATDPHRELLNEYCVVCHNDKAKTGGLTLETIDASSPAQHGEVWEKVVRKVRSGSMPPVGMPRPEKTEMDGFVSFIETSLDRAAAAKPQPGRVTVHRMNRAEYAATVRDLLDLKVDPAQLLPPDDESYGFDNNSDVLGVSPVLIERYLSASRKVSRLAVGDPKQAPVAETYKARPDLSQDKHVDGLPLGTRGGLVATHNFPLDGEYSFKVVLAGNTVDVLRGLEEVHEVQILVDGRIVHSALVGGADDTKKLEENPAQMYIDVGKRLTAKAKVSAGPHVVGATFVEKNQAMNDQLLQPYLRTTLDPVDETGLPHVNQFIVAGPFNATGAGDTPSRRRIFACKPVKQADEIPCARKILGTLAHRAYRRPLNDADMEAVLGFYQQGRNRGNFEEGVENGLRYILSNPDFLFRFERDPAAVPVGGTYRISDLELASRLSYFLWSSIPDEQLLKLAETGRLRAPGMLEAQVRRMLADPKSSALVNNFAAQWLYLRNLKGIAPDPQEYPDFDDNLRVGLRRETELFFESIVREDRNVIDLLTADYTYMNERVARHYGVKGVYGEQFRRVPVTDERRRGLLGQASILTVTSLATRTSPVVRGKWILTNMLGVPPPEPPPNVPALADNKSGAAPKTLRERMEEHRKNPTCASCHKVMDPLGFALENFDAIGQWRSRDAGAPIDTKVQLATGETVDGAVDLRNQLLLKQPDQFVKTFTGKLMTYSLGRGLDYNDAPVVRAITREAAKQNYKFSSLVVGIVTSAPFQMRTKQEAPLVGEAR